MRAIQYLTIGMGLFFHRRAAAAELPLAISALQGNRLAVAD
jgi:hypothetical protein